MTTWAPSHQSISLLRVPVFVSWAAWLVPTSEQEMRHEPCVCAQVASKLDKDDLDKIEKEVDEAISWLDANQLAETEELEHKLKELEGVCSPIISKMYAGAGGACLSP